MPCCHIMHHMCVSSPHAASHTQHEQDVKRTRKTVPCQATWQGLCTKKRPEAGIGILQYDSCLQLMLPPSSTDKTLSARRRKKTVHYLQIPQKSVWWSDLAPRTHHHTCWKSWWTAAWIEQMHSLLHGKIFWANHNNRTWLHGWTRQVCSLHD